MGLPGVQDGGFNFCETLTDNDRCVLTVVIYKKFDTGSLMGA